MGIKTKIVLGIVEIAAMVLLKVYAVKIALTILPRGARASKFPDGTPIVRQEEPAYHGESPDGENNAADFPGSESAPDEGLRGKARRVLRRWFLSWRNLFHKPHRAEQWPPRILQRLEEARKRGELPPYEFNISTDHKREPGKTE